MNRNIYFYKSSNSRDAINHIVILASSPLRALTMAINLFKRNNYRGIPIRLAI